MFAQIASHRAALVQRVALPEEGIAEPVPVAAAGICGQRLLILRDVLFESFGGIAGERNVRPRVAADVHSRVDPDVQSLLRVRIVLELARIDESVGAFQMIGPQFSGQGRRDSCAVLTGRKAARGGQVIKCQRNHRVRCERRQAKRRARFLPLVPDRARTEAVR